MRVCLLGGMCSHCSTPNPPAPNLDTEVLVGAEEQFAIYQYPGQNVARSPVQVLQHSEPGAAAALLPLEGEWGPACLLSFVIFSSSL